MERAVDGVPPSLGTTGRLLTGRSWALSVTGFERISAKAKIWPKVAFSAGSNHQSSRRTFRDNFCQFFCFLQSFAAFRRSEAAIGPSPRLSHALRHPAAFCLTSQASAAQKLRRSPWQRIREARRKVFGRPRFSTGSCVLWLGFWGFTGWSRGCETVLGDLRGTGC